MASAAGPSLDQLFECSANNKFLTVQLLSFLSEKREIERVYVRSLKKLIKHRLFNADSGLGPVLRDLQFTYRTLVTRLKQGIELVSGDLLPKLEFFLGSTQLLIQKEKASAQKLKEENSKTLAKFKAAQLKYFRNCIENENTPGDLPRYVLNKELEKNSFLKYTSSVDSIQKSLWTYKDQKTHMKEVLGELEVQRLLLLQGVLSASTGQTYRTHQCYLELLNSVSLVLSEYEPQFPPTAKSWAVLGPRTSISNIEMVHDPSTVLIQRVVEKSWGGLELSAAELSSFSLLVESHEGKKGWSFVLNDRRNNGQFAIPHVTFTQVGGLMRTVLDAIARNSDLKYMKQCIILSQTFYSEGEGDKQYLHQLIKDHPVWGQPNVWLQVVREATAEEMSNYIENCFTDRPVPDEQLTGVFRDISTSQITSYVFIMKLFELPEGLVASVKEQLQEEYQVELVDF